MNSSLQLLCSTGAFSRYPDYVGYQQVLEHGPQLDVDGFELMFYPGWYSDLERIAADLRRSGLRFPAMHTEKSIGVALGSSQPEQREQGVRWLTANCQLGSQLGTEVLVLHLWGWPELDDHLEYNLELLNKCLDITTQYGVELAIETIPCRQTDPLTNVHRALERDGRCRIALDTEFLAHYDQVEAVFDAEWLWQGNTVRHVHIKDFDGHPFSSGGVRRYLHPGEGYVDFAGFFAGLKRRGLDGYVSLEAPAIDKAGRVDIGRLRGSLELVRLLCSSVNHLS